MLRIGRSLLLMSLLTIILPAPAAAQDAPQPDKLNIRTFEVAVGTNTYITQHGARVPEHLGFGIGLMLDYARNPFTIYNVDSSGNRGDVRTAVVKDLFVGELYGYLGLFKRLSLGLSMPMALYMSGTETNDLGEPATGGKLSAFAWGDVALHVKAFIYEMKNGLTLGAQLTITAPTGQFSKHFIGDELLTFRPRFILEFRHRVFSMAANLGGLFRIKEEGFYGDNFHQGQNFTYGVGLAVRPAKKVPLRIFAEYFGRSDFTTRVDRNPMEVGLALGYGLPRGVHLMLGATAGVLAGIGTPDFRVFFGLRWSPSFKDSDGDGVPDERDKCPDQKEDKDGFEDDDGCPDPDNDKDGIPDKLDKCPNQPEDFDKFQDDDGCPDLDNDGDGIPDKQDNCPMHKGPASSKGCPPDMLDEDGDGIPDTRDKCPKQAEDKDGFEDDDGCPDPDNDKDGIPDEHDKCPNVPEDKDGFEDADGCPDADDDDDGVCDDNPTIQALLRQGKLRGVCIGADKCPKSKETINGRKDSDGCPDRGAGNVQLSAVAGSGYKGRFLTTGVKTWFNGMTTELTGTGQSTLTQLAHMLRMKAYKPLAKIVIMGFAEPQFGAKAKQITQAWADAARSFLIKQGIAADRLAAVGAGGASPLCKRRSRRCKRKNRRIEFFITEIRQ
ncbi:MAG: OmpA family protein [bacterium]